MKNKLTARVLSHLLEVHEWSQGDLGARSGIARSLVSAHLAGQRGIRDHHLVRYLHAADRVEKPMILAAWMRDQFPSEIIHELFPPQAYRTAERDEPTIYARPEILEWTPSLDDEQRSMLAWWADKLVRDPELDEIFRGITRKAGWKP